MTGSKNASLLTGVLGRALAYLEGAQSRRVSPGKAELPRLSELGGLPRGTAGGLVTGASIANFCGLAAARHLWAALRSLGRTGLASAFIRRGAKC